MGSNAAWLIAELGGKIVAVADHAGAVHKDDGLDVPALVDWVKGTGRFMASRGAMLSTAPRS